MPYKTLTFTSLLSLFIILSACHGRIIVKEDGSEAQESVTKSVAAFADTVAAGVSTNGVSAWLNYFSQSPNFYMASDGVRVFPSYDTASNEIKEKLSKQIRKISLSWNQMHIDSLSPSMAGFSSRFHEELDMVIDTIISTSGYVTGEVEKTPGGWKFRNLHWSISH